MQNFSKDEIINHINKLVDTEIKNCNDYCNLNPEKTAARNHDKQVYFSALMQLEYALQIRK